MIDQQTFDGLAFPVCRVRYSGDASNYNASIRRDSERTYRAREPCDHAVGGGARGAIAAALKCHARALADTGGGDPADYIAIPGDMDADTYVFTFVPRELLS